MNPSITSTSPQNNAEIVPPPLSKNGRGWPATPGLQRWTLTGAETSILAKPGDPTATSVMKAGEEVDFLAIESSGGKKWCKVKLANGQIGYVSGDTGVRRLTHVKLDSPSAEIRNVPDATGSVLRQLNKGDTLLLLKTVKSGADDWVQIRSADGQEGFMSGKTKIKQLDAQVQVQGSAQRDMLVGALWCIGGTIATAIGYSSASDSANSDGGSHTYFVFWGAIIFGGIQFLKGLFRLGQKN